MRAGWPWLGPEWASRTFGARFLAAGGRRGRDCRKKAARAGLIGSRQQQPRRLRERRVRSACVYPWCNRVGVMVLLRQSRGRRHFLGSGVGRTSPPAHGPCLSFSAHHLTLHLTCLHHQQILQMVHAASLEALISIKPTCLYVLVYPRIVCLAFFSAHWPRGRTNIGATPKFLQSGPVSTFGHSLSCSSTELKALFRFIMFVCRPDFYTTPSAPSRSSISSMV